MAAAKNSPAARQNWLDPTTQTPLIDDYARHLGTFLDAVADGKIDDREMAAQEQRLIAAMQEVEPLLDDALHAKITRLLCELTAYDVMQVMHAMHAARPTVKFQG
jgi:hypothetical protein